MGGRLFNNFDISNSGQITEEEFLQGFGILQKHESLLMFSALYCRCSRDVMIEQLFDLYDQERKGVLEWETFQTILYNYPKEKLREITDQKSHEAISQIHMSSRLRSIANINKEFLKQVQSVVLSQSEIQRAGNQGPHCLTQTQNDLKKNAQVLSPEEVRMERKKSKEAQFERLESYATHVNFKVQQFARDVQRRFSGEKEEKMTKRNFRLFIQDHPALLIQFQQVFHQDFWTALPDSDGKDILSYTKT